MDPKNIESYASKAKMDSISFSLCCSFHPEENWLTCRSCPKPSFNKGPKQKSLFDMLAEEYKRAPEAWQKQKIHAAASLLRDAILVKPKNKHENSAALSIPTTTSIPEKKDNAKSRRNAKRAATRKEDLTIPPNPNPFQPSSEVCQDPLTVTATTVMHTLDDSDDDSLLNPANDILNPTDAVEIKSNV